MHRDVSPHNVLLSYDGEVKIADFGIVKAADRFANATSLGAIKGKCHYMSPEQVISQPLDHRSDIFTVGIILWEMLAGQPLFAGDSAYSILDKIRIADIPPPSLHNAAIPSRLEKVILKALAHNVADRYLFCEQMREDLLPFLQFGNFQYSAKHFSQCMHHAFATDYANEQEWLKLAASLPVDLSESSARATSAVHDQSEGSSGEKACPDQKESPPSEIDSIEKFLRMLFHNVTRWEEGWRLQQAKQPLVSDLEFYALFINGDHGSVGECTFVSHANSLEQRLRRLPDHHSSQPRIVIVITKAAELGKGVRRKIREYRDDLNVLILPIYLGELRTALASKRETEILRERLDDLHSGHNPYSEKAPLDATRLFGMRSVLNQLVDAISNPGAIVSILGPPGAGKTTLVNRVELDWNYGNDPFIYVRCANFDERSVDKIIEDIESKMRQKFPGWRPTGHSQLTQEDLRETMVNAVPSMGAFNSQPVLVLEDADWIINLLGNNNRYSPNDVAVIDAQRFWKSIAVLSNSRSLRTIITSVRGFVLAESRINSWENPLASCLLTIKVPPLDINSMKKMVCELGITICFRYTPAALERIFEFSGGQVEIVRKLCQQIVLDARTRTPLAEHEVTVSEVDHAAERLVALGSTFRDFWGWLENTERLVLQEIACSRPRSIRKIKRALDGQLTSNKIEEAAEQLRSMGFIDRTVQRREQVLGELFAMWICEHIERTEPGLAPRSTRRLRWVATGCTVTAVLFAAWHALRSDNRSLRNFQVDGCTYTINYPEKSASGERQSFHFSAKCPSGKVKPVGFTVQNGTSAAFGDKQIFFQDALDCKDASECRPKEYPIELRFPEPGTQSFSFQVSINGVLQSPDLKVSVDGFRALKRQIVITVRYLVALPAALGLILTFYNDIQAKLQQIGSVLSSILGRRRYSSGSPGNTSANS